MKTMVLLQLNVLFRYVISDFLRKTDFFFNLIHCYRVQQQYFIHKKNLIV